MAETVKLAIIFNKSTTALFRLLSARLKEELIQQITSMPGETVNASDAEARQATLNRLADQLPAANSNSHEEEK